MHLFGVETARLQTRPISAADEPLFTQLYTDEETMRFIGAPLSAERAASSFRAALAGMQRSPIERLFLTVIEKASLRDVGICSLQNCDPQLRSVQAGVMFIPGARARGYAKEAFVGLIQRVFAELPVDRLWVQFSDQHVAVQRGVISVGFTRSPDTGQEARPAERSVWSVCRDRWVAPSPRIPDDISDGKQA
jgi:RimJ/RimL family protein N-acetyltransferase